MKIKNKVRLFVILLLSLGMPLYYKVKYIILDYIELKDIIAVKGLLDVLFGLIIGILIVYGHEFIVIKLRKRFQKDRDHTSRLIIQFIASIFYATSISYLFATFFWEILLNIPLNGDFVLDLILIAIMVPIVVNGITESVFILGEYEREVKLKEQLEKENIKSKYEILKNQISPHFLFNCLNSLAVLIEESKDKSLIFLKKLSISYRFILESSEKELVSLKKELEALSAYVYLMDVRFGDNFQLSLDVNDAQQEQYFLAPLSLQILLENVLKHNKTDVNSNLKIAVSLDQNSRLHFKNNKTGTPVNRDSIGLGLKNLVARYSIISHQKIEIENDLKYFSVKLPLIQNIR